MKEKFNIFGSETSLDLDVMVFVDRIPDKETAKMLCIEYDAEIESSYDYDKKVNTNLAVVDDGVIVEVFKGFPEECNNSLMRTYELHEQVYPLMVERPIPWTKEMTDLKISRFLRIVLTFLSRTQHRVDVKRALKSKDDAIRLDVLRSIDLEFIYEFNKKGLDTIEIYKGLAFQIGQTLGLLDGVELYSKTEISRVYPMLEPYLLRQVSDPSHLQYMLRQLLIRLVDG